MKTKEQILDMINSLAKRRDEHLSLAEMADTSSGEDYLIDLAESDIDWIEALEWVLEND